MQHAAASSWPTHQLSEQPVGKAMPACSPLAAISSRTLSSRVSHSVVISMPGLITERMYVRT